MKTVIAASAAFTVALIFGAPAVAQDMPIPKMFKGMQAQQKGQYEMEILEGGGGQVKPGTKMTICTDNLMKQSGGPAAKDKPAAKSDCKHRLLKDTADEAVMENKCPDRTTTVTVKRENAKAMLMTMDSTGPRGPQHMKMRYTHLGPCREGQSTMSFDKNSEQCQKIRAQVAQMDPAKQCAGQKGADRQTCEQHIKSARDQLSGMCN